MVSTRTRAPSSVSRSRTMAPAKGSLRASNSGAEPMTVSSRTPRASSQVAASQATTPPPMTTTRAGTSCRLVVSREDQGSASRSPGTGGMAAVLPVSMTTACRAVNVRTDPSGAVTSTCLTPTSRPTPRTTSMLLSVAHFT